MTSACCGARSPARSRRCGAGTQKSNSRPSSLPLPKRPSLRASDRLRRSPQRQGARSRRLPRPQKGPAPRASPPPPTSPPGGGRRPPPPPPPPPLAPLERRLKQRLARGTRDIDARLDLHGRTQSQAHAALLRFVQKCQAEG